MSQSLLETITPLLKSENLFCVRTGAGRESQFWSTNFGDHMTIRVKADSVALCWTIVYDKPSEKSHPLVLRREDGTDMIVTSLDAFLEVKDEWVDRVKRGY